MSVPIGNQQHKNLFVLNLIFLVCKLSNRYSFHLPPTEPTRFPSRNNYNSNRPPQLDSTNSLAQSDLCTSVHNETKPFLIWWVLTANRGLIINHIIHMGQSNRKGLNGGGWVQSSLGLICWALFLGCPQKSVWYFDKKCWCIFLNQCLLLNL